VQSCAANDADRVTNRFREAQHLRERLALVHP